MRTTLDIAEDVLIAAKDLARYERKTTGQVISELARKGLGATDVPVDEDEFLGFRPLPKGDVVVTNELINRLREEIGE
jgi:hypothetical protein